jgi:hypothetical protein
MSDRPTCTDCGRFFKFESGVAWRMVYTGHPPEPDREIYKCRKCVEKNGPFAPQDGIKPECSCGIMKAAQQGSPDP